MEHGGGGDYEDEIDDLWPLDSQPPPMPPQGGLPHRPFYSAGPYMEQQQQQQPLPPPMQQVSRSPSSNSAHRRQLMSASGG